MFCVSVLRRNLVIMKWASWVRQTGPEQMTTPGTDVSFMPLVPGVWCGPAGRPNTWTSLKAAQVSPQSCLSAQRRRAEAAEPEVLRSHPLPLQRPAESVVGGRSHCLACRCAASDMFWRLSESPRAPRRDAIGPRYSQHAGDADNERHVEFGTVMGAVCNQGRGLGADPIGCRRS